MSNKEKCNCGKMAVWLYAPGYSGGGNPFSCDDCVHRGCTCNWCYSTVELPTDEDKPWKWVIQTKDEEYGEIEEGKVWVSLDEKGREYPCAEYDYEDEGFDIDENIDTHCEDEFER